VPEHASDSRTPREWVREVPLPGGIENVGRQARRKEMEKLARRAQQQEADDPADWFQNSRNEKNRGGSGRDRERSQSGPRKVAGSSTKGPPPFKFAAASSSKLSLVDRLTAPVPDRSRDATSGSKSRDRHSDSRDRAADSRHRNEYERDSRKERERDKERRPRYNGGYSR
jgi:protein AIR1/2